MIYSEVATLISQNEQRPHFLLELFRELQLLTSEHLRTRALQAIRNVLNRYLFNEGHMQEPDHNHVSQFRYIKKSLGFCCIMSKIYYVLGASSGGLSQRC